MIEDPFDSFVEEWDSELVELYKTIQSTTAVLPIEEVTVEQMRQGMLSDPSNPIVKLEIAQEREIPGPAGKIPIRVFVPSEVNGIYLHLHGGGWMSGAQDLEDPHLWSRAQEASVAVVSVGYRLAPENPYPAGPDDCEAAALWLIQNAQKEFGTDDIVVGGGSAGAHLSAVTLLRLRDRHQFTGFRGAELRYGLYDLRLTPSVRLAPKGMLTAQDGEWFRNQFVGAKLLEDPDVSPIFADLRGMPPALFIVGSMDSLVDDSLFMWARWRAAGNRAELRIYPGAPHGFDLMQLKIAAMAKADIARFIGECLEGASSHKFGDR